MTSPRATEVEVIEKYSRRIAAVKNDRASAAIEADLSRDIETNPELVQRLLHEPTLRVREWMLSTVVDLLGRAAGPLLVDAYRRDPDGDIRSDALRQLLELDPRLADPLKPKLRQQLQSTDFFEPEDALWALLDLRDTAAEPDVQALAEARSDGLGLIAAIVAHALRGEDEVIAGRLLRHDEHYLTNWLARAAAKMQSPRARRALVEAARDLPDEECRSACQSWLDRSSARDIAPR